MKTLIVVSTGRCGTTRLAEILSNYAPENFKVVHQVGISRMANILGNLMLIFGNSEFIKKTLINVVLPSGKQGFISTDPLFSLVLPKSLVFSNDVSIIHLTREKQEFGESFYRFSRKKKMSFIAHNFIPFWQPKVLLFENLIKGSKMIDKYAKVAAYKEKIFDKMYSDNPNYVKITMSDFFDQNRCNEIMSDFFTADFGIPAYEFETKANQST